jgi:hypothetical protein
MGAMTKSEHFEFVAAKPVIGPSPPMLTRQAAWHLLTERNPLWKKNEFTGIYKLEDSPMRKLASYIRKYGQVDGEKLYRLLQREAALASAVARKEKALGIK